MRLPYPKLLVVIIGKNINTFFEFRLKIDMSNKISTILTFFFIFFHSKFFSFQQCLGKKGRKNFVYRLNLQ